MNKILILVAAATLLLNLVVVLNLFSFDWPRNQPGRNPHVYLNPDYELDDDYLNYKLNQKHQELEYSDYSNEYEEPKNISLSEDLVDCINQFGISLYRLSFGETQNYVISGYSLFDALLMVLPGAKNLTKLEIANTLFSANNNVEEIDAYEQLGLFNSAVKSTKNNQHTMNIVDKIYSQSGLEIAQDYIDFVKLYFKVDFEYIDFGNNVAAAKTINKWLGEKTGGKISQMIDPSWIKPTTAMFLLNAMYFKGSWLKPFGDKSEKHEFTLEDGSRTKVDMMKVSGRFDCLRSPLGVPASVCRLPYEGDQMSMTILLPNGNFSLVDVERSLDVVKIRKILDPSYLNYNKVDIRLPKFKIQYKQEMTKNLMDLGIKEAFHSNADFRGIRPEKDLYISKIVHQVEIEVNEHGTEAAAGSAVEMELVHLVENEIHEFVCDRPFMFLIHDNLNRCVFFIGKFTRPL